MIVRIEIEGARAGFFAYRVSYESEDLYGDAGLASLADCLVAAVEGMAPDVLAAEVWYQNIVSGTYTLPVIGMQLDQIAAHAANTTAAIEEVANERR
jgi:hypothetical protein